MWYVHISCWLVRPHRYQTQRTFYKKTCFYIIFIVLLHFNHVYVYAHITVWVCACECRHPRMAKLLVSLRLQLEAFLTCHCVVNQTLGPLQEEYDSYLQNHVFSAQFWLLPVLLVQSQSTRNRQQSHIAGDPKSLGSKIQN